MSNIRYVGLLTAVAVLLGIKIAQDGFDMDWGDVAFSACCVVIGVLFNNYFQLTSNYNNVCYITLENRRNVPVFLQWGTAGDGNYGFTDYIQLDPNHAICRRVMTGHSSLSSRRPCARICQDKLSTRGNITMILWDPEESCYTKVYQITDEGVAEFRNPDQRSWHDGQLQTYQAS